MRMNDLEVNNEWTERAKRLLKAELKRANVTYDELAKRLSLIGFDETKASIASKLSRGAFQASFMLATFKAIGKEVVNLNDI